MTKIRKVELKLIRSEETFKNFLASIFESEVRELLASLRTFAHFQLKIRPRIRLIFKVLPMLALVFLASNTAVAYLKSKEAEIKINGQQIIVAQAQKADEPGQKLDEVAIDQKVDFARSPFEFEKPVDSGYVSQGFRSYHRAHDIATSLGAGIHPVGAGIVEFAGYTADGKGNIVIVDHGDGLKSLYAHMGKIQVGVGNMVNTKTTIGTVGLTGRTTGAHVHLEIHDNGLVVDPGNLLPQN